MNPYKEYNAYQRYNAKQQDEASGKYSLWTKDAFTNVVLAVCYLAVSLLMAGVLSWVIK